VTRGWIAALALLCAGVSPPPRADFFARLSRAAVEQGFHPVVYDPSYRRIPYPGGDVPPGVGVCSDVVIRAYRAVGIHLQQRVHDDMARAFAAYPGLWGLSRPDPNIDHRRVPNLGAYLARRGAARPISDRPEAYQTGDLVVWKLAGNRPHIGIVTARRSADGRRPLVVHNAGSGPRLEDALFEFPITGHYRYRE
jgi:uncharacterized protein YijF (DUF1287 family)